MAILRSSSLSPHLLPFSSHFMSPHSLHVCVNVCVFYNTPLPPHPLRRSAEPQSTSHTQIHTDTCLCTHTHTPGMWCRKGEQHPTPVSGNRMMKEVFTSWKEATNTHKHTVNCKHTNTHKIIQTCHADSHRSTESHAHKLTAACLFFCCTHAHRHK